MGLRDGVQVIQFGAAAFISLQAGGRGAVAHRILIGGDQGPRAEALPALCCGRIVSEGWKDGEAVIRAASHGLGDPSRHSGRKDRGIWRTGLRAAYGYGLHGGNPGT